MVYYAVFGFLIPILLRLGWYKKSFWGVLAPTFCTYAIWYVLSFFLITVGCKNNYYLWIFLIFPSALLLYETILFVKEIFIRKTRVNKKMCFVSIGVILIFALVNIFTYKIFWDTNSYIQMGINFYQKNEFSNNPVYRFNSFYYLAAVIFGIYQAQFFYSVFNPYLFGSLIVLLSLNFIKGCHPKIYKWFFVAAIAVLAAFVANTQYAIEGNWIVGVVVGIAFLNMFMLKPTWQELVLFDVMIFFLLNFSVTAFVVGGFLTLVLKGKFFLEEKKIAPFSTLFPFVFLTWVLVFKNNDGGVRLITIVFFFASFLLTFTFLLLFRNTKFKFLFLKKLNTSDLKKIYKVILRKKFVIFNTVYFLVALPVIIFGTIHFPLPISENLSDFNYQQNKLLAFCIIACVLLVGLLFANFWLYLGMEYVIWILFFFGTEFFSYYIVENLPFLRQLLPHYLSNRVWYLISFFMIFMFLIATLVWINNVWKRAPVYFFTFLPFFSAIFPLSKINPVFSTSIKKNNEQTSNANLQVFLQNESLFTLKNEKIYSEVELPVPSIPTQLMYYNREIIAIHNSARNTSIFDLLSLTKRLLGEKNAINQMVTRNNKYLNHSTFFNVLVLHKNSTWLKNPNILKNYKIVSARHTKANIYICVRAEETK